MGKVIELHKKSKNRFGSSDLKINELGGYSALFQPLSTV